MKIPKMAALGALLLTSTCSSDERITTQEWDETYRHPVSLQWSAEEAAKTQEITGKTRVYLSDCVGDTASGVVKCNVIDKNAPPRPFPMSM